MHVNRTVATRALPVAALILPLCVILSAARAATIEQSLALLKAVQKEGKGHQDAPRAMRDLATADAKDLPAILKGFDGASPLAANWIRSAFESAADRALRAKRPLPATEIEWFLKDRSHDPRARRLAYEWLAKFDPTASARLIPDMLLDPSAEFRRDAVALKLAEAAKVDANKQRDQAIRLYREAFTGAVHDDQVKLISQALRKLGQKVDVCEHFAFLTHFSVIGPFDNRGGKGLEAVYPPEREIRLDAEYPGQFGPVSWKPISTANEYGIVDIAKQVKPYKGAAMYLVTGFRSPRERSVELRLGTQNAWKIWLNGEFLFARDEYHRGMAMDQYRVPAALRAGDNTILLKICQNEQKEDWAQSYQFQLRVCDSSGSGIHSLPIAVSGGKP